SATTNLTNTNVWFGSPLTLSTSPINIVVNSTTGFLASGTLTVQTTTGFATVTYTGLGTDIITGKPDFLNCTIASGTATMVAPATDFTSLGSTIIPSGGGTMSIPSVYGSLLPSSNGQLEVLDTSNTFELLNYTTAATNTLTGITT